jgi:hypothetical protein
MILFSLKIPLFGKEAYGSEPTAHRGYGEILWRIDLFKKSPSIPARRTWEDARKDSLRVLDLTSGNDNEKRFVFLASTVLP